MTSPGVSQDLGDMLLQWDAPLASSAGMPLLDLLEHLGSLCDLVTPLIKAMRPGVKPIQALEHTCRQHSCRGTHLTDLQHLSIPSPAHQATRNETSRGMSSLASWQHRYHNPLQCMSCLGRRPHSSRVVVFRRLSESERMVNPLHLTLSCRRPPLAATGLQLASV